MAEDNQGATMSESLKAALSLEQWSQGYFDEILICRAANGYIVQIHHPNYGAPEYVFTNRKEMWAWLAENVADTPEKGEAAVNEY